MESDWEQGAEICEALFQAPSWAYLQAALGLFVYQTLDATDGKQARRTGSSSPLGELFDHGCDSMAQGFFNCCFTRFCFNVPNFHKCAVFLDSIPFSVSYIYIFWLNITT